MAVSGDGKGLANQGYEANTARDLSNHCKASGELSTLDAAVLVLRESGQPMTASDGELAIADDNDAPGSRPMWRCLRVLAGLRDRLCGGARDDDDAVAAHAVRHGEDSFKAGDSRASDSIVASLRRRAPGTVGVPCVILAPALGAAPREVDEWLHPSNPFTIPCSVLYEPDR